MDFLAVWTGHNLARGVLTGFFIKMIQEQGFTLSYAFTVKDVFGTLAKICRCHDSSNHSQNVRMTPNDQLELQSMSHEVSNNCKF